MMAKFWEYYMSIPYRIEIIKDKEEGGYALLCPELPGCITCGKTVDEGMQRLEDAKRSWFQACLDTGVPIPNPAH